jgi:hypothetical protein
MRTAFRGLLAAACLASIWGALWGCSPKNDPDDAAGGACTSNLQCLNGQECSGGKCVPFNSAASGNGGSPNGGGTPGVGGSPGSGGSAGATAGGSAGNGGGAPLECSHDPNLALHGGWIGCDPADTTDNPMGLQGSLYMYHDGATCTSPVEACGATGCCIKGTTVVDATFAKWGCGLGFELNSSGGDASVKKAYAGPVKCFDIKLTGSSGGNPVRIAYTQSDAMDGKVAPFLELKPLTAGFTGTVCFDDVTCPTEWMPAPDVCSAAPSICRSRSSVATPRARSICA